MALAGVDVASAAMRDPQPWESLGLFLERLGCEYDVIADRTAIKLNAAVTCRCFASYYGVFVSPGLTAAGGAVGGATEGSSFLMHFQLQAFCSHL